MVSIIRVHLMLPSNLSYMFRMSYMRPKSFLDTLQLNGSVCEIATRALIPLSRPTPAPKGLGMTYAKPDIKTGAHTVRGLIGSIKY